MRALDVLAFRSLVTDMRISAMCVKSSQRCAYSVDIHFIVNSKKEYIIEARKGRE